MRTAAIAVLLLLLGCSSDEERHRFRIVEENGVRVALTTGGPRYSEPLFRYEPVLTLKQDPNREESLLYRPSQFFMGTDGYFYVSDYKNYRIAVFNPQGEYERFFGGKGAGPGEFGDFWGISQFDGSIFTVQDYFQRRLTRFRADGELLEIITPSSGGMFDEVYYLPDGRLVGIDGERDFREEFQYSRALVLVTNASMDDTMTVIRSDWVKTSRETTLDDGSRGLPRPMIYFTSPSAVYVEGKGFLITSGIEPVLDWYDLEGNLREQIRIDLTHLTVTAAMRSQYMNEYNKSLTEQENPRPPRPREWFAFPENVGFWRSARVDDAGYIWLRDVLDASRLEFEEGYLFHVIDPRGQYLGTTRLPSDLGWNIYDGKLLNIDRDEETGARIPTVYRIVPAVSGLKYP